MKGVDLPVAEALVEAGFDSPSKIRSATDKALKALPGIGTAAVKKLRGRFPRQ